MLGASSRTSSQAGRVWRKSTEPTRQRRELLAIFADAAREWHAEIAEISGVMTDQHFGEETVKAMHVELEVELECKG